MTSLLVGFGAGLGDKANTASDATNGTWGTDIVHNTTSPIHGRFDIQCTGSAARNLEFRPGTNIQSMYGHVRVKLPSSFTGISFLGMLMLLLRNGTNSGEEMRLGITSAGKLRIQNGQGTNLVTGTAVLSPDTVYTFQLDVPSYGAGVTVVGRVYDAAGTTLLDTISVSTTTSSGGVITTASVKAGIVAAPGTSVTVQWDDLIVLDTAAPHPTSYVAIENPLTAGSQQQWTGSVSNIDDMTDQTGPDVLSDEISDSTLNHKFSFTLSSTELPSTVTGVYGIAVAVRSLRGATSGEARLYFYDGTNTDEDSTPVANASSVLTTVIKRSVAPDGSAWTKAKLSSVELGFRNNQNISAKVRCVSVAIAVYGTSGGGGGSTVPPLLALGLNSLNALRGLGNG